MMLLHSLYSEASMSRVKNALHNEFQALELMHDELAPCRRTCLRLI